MTIEAEKLWSVLNGTYRGLSKWDLRIASYDNPVASLTFILFLKFISDNKKTLNLEYQELYEFDYLSLLYGEKIHQYDIVNHVTCIERQLGLDGNILSTFAAGFELLKMEKEFSQILNEIKGIELGVKNDSDYSLVDALIGFLMMQFTREIRFAGESITEANLAKLMAEIAQIKDGMEAYDFASGYGVLLTQLAKNKSISIFAQDINNISAALSIMMLVFTGVKDINVYCGDSLNHPLTLNWSEPRKFDRVLSTPPFGMNASRINESKNLDMAFEFGLGNSSKTDLVFAQHAIASIKDNGVAVLLLPVGALFRGGREASLRKMMLDKNYIDSVIELPNGIVPSTSIKTAIVIFKKDRSKRDVFFVDLSKETAKDFIERSGRAAVKITDRGVEKIADIINNKKIIAGLSKFVSQEEINDNGLNMSAGAYLNLIQNDVIEIADITSLKNKSSELMKKFISLENEFEQIISRL